MRNFYTVFRSGCLILVRLVILDYLTLNADHGLDDFMIKCCDIDYLKWVRHANQTWSRPSYSEILDVRALYGHPIRADDDPIFILRPPTIPCHSPTNIQSFTYRWLHPPIGIIGRPFSERTSNHFLPLLTSKSWWEETAAAQAAVYFGSGHPSKDVQRMSLLRQKTSLWFLMVARSETASCY